MSIINKMLQDLDRRQGLSDTEAATAIPQVRTVPPLRKDREWFWRIIAVLMVLAVGWVAWIAWQLQPRESIATEQAFKAAQAPRVARAAVQAPAAPPPAPMTPTEQKPAMPALAPEAEKPAASAAVVQAEKPAAPAADVKAEKPAAPQVEAPKAPAKKTVAASKPAPAPAAPRSLNLDVPAARILQAPAAQAQGPARLEKLDRVRSPDERAEAEFRRGVGLLNQGRSSEAEEAFAGALAVSPSHEAARQALVAMQLEQRRIDEARRLLQEGVALNPGNARFAAVLGRVLLERKDYAGALDTVNGLKGPGQGDPDVQSIRGTALQRLGRHAEAVDAFQAALRREPQNGAVWMGLGISFEALGRKPDASEAFRRAAATGSLGNEARSYAEQRARQLQ